MNKRFKNKLLSVLLIITLTIPLIPVYAWTPSFTNRDPGSYNAGLTNVYPNVKQAAKELLRVTFVDSTTGVNAYPPFFLSAQDIIKVR